MRALEAKDFLVQQTAEQAALENVPLSDLEKRMMYFTETDECPEDPVALNEAFEAEYNTEEYEAKISRLLHHGYQSLRKENDAARKNWDLAIKCLRRGDHYLLVMWDTSPPTQWSVPYFLKILAGSLGVIFLMFLIILAQENLQPQWKWIQKHTPTLPSPNQHVLSGIFIAFVLAVFFFPRRVGNAVDWLMDRTLFRFWGRKDDEKDSE